MLALAVCFICCYIEVCVCVCATSSHQVEVMNAIGSESKEKVEGKRGRTREEGGRESGKGEGLLCTVPFQAIHVCWECLKELQQTYSGVSHITWCTHATQYIHHLLNCEKL